MLGALVVVGLSLAIITFKGQSQAAAQALVPNRVAVSRQTLSGGVQSLATTTDKTLVSRLYHDIVGLKAVPPGTPYHCPMDRGITLTLTFSENAKVFLIARDDVSGCAFITVGEKAYFSSKSFLSDRTAVLMGMTQAQLLGP